MDNDPRIEVMSPKGLLEKIGLPKPNKLELFEENLRRQAGFVTKSAEAADSTKGAIEDLFSDGPAAPESGQVVEDDSNERIEKERRVDEVMHNIKQLNEVYPNDGDDVGIISGNIYLCSLEYLLRLLDCLEISYMEVLPQLTDDLSNEIRNTFLVALSRDATAQIEDPDYVGTFDSRFGFDVNRDTNLGPIGSVSTFLKEPGDDPKLKQLAQDSVEYQQTLKKYMAVKFKRMLARSYVADRNTPNVDINPITIKNPRTNYGGNELADWLRELQELGLEVKDVLSRELDEVFTVVSNDGRTKNEVPDNVAKEYFRVLMATTHEMSYSFEFLAEKLGAYDGPPHIPGRPEATTNTWARFYKAHEEHFSGMVELTTKTVIDPRKLGAMEVSND